ncbi:unnamed protein product, partial [Polarella glacialis]
MGEKNEKKIGPYLLGGLIGRGGFGSVYKALDQQRALFVAIKQVGHTGLQGGDIGSIEVEINLLSKLKHRNIVKYIDSIRTENHLNIVLEFVEGGSLAGIIKKFGAFPESLCAIYTLQILKGLKFLHGQGVIHRDIKGANVLTTKTGIIKLADFGVATKLNEIDSSKRRVVGTPYWMAPEIVEMSNPTPASDIWSVGSTVIEMVTEKPPYSDLPQMAAMYRVVSDPHPPLPEGFSQALEHFLMSCFEKDPVRRAPAEMLINHDWITSNKLATFEFTRQLLSPKVPPPPSENSPKEQEDSEYGDEEIEAFTTLVGSIGDMQDAVPDGAVVATPAAADDPKGGRPSMCSLPLSLVPRLAGSLKPTPRSARSNRSGDAQGLDEEIHDDPTLREGMHLDADLPHSLREVDFHIPTVATKYGETGDEVEKSFEVAGYHFAFLDYYNTYCQAQGDADEYERRVSGDKTSLSFSREGLDSGDQPTQKMSRLPRSGSRISKSANLPLFDQVPKKQPPPLTQLELGVASAGDREGQRVAAEIKSLLASIRPFEEPGVLVGVCKRLTELLQPGKRNQENIQQVMQHGAVPIVEMLQVTDPTLLRSVLKVVNQIIDGNQGFQDTFAMVGLFPGVIKFARPHFSRPLRQEAATFISTLCHSSARSLQMLIACGGLEAIVDLISHDYYHNRDLVWLALDAVNTVLNMPGSHSRDLCRILAKHGLCGHLCLLVDTLASDIHDRAAPYLKVVVSLLLFFARQSDAVAKAYMAKGPVLEGLIASLEFLPPDLAAQVCQTFKHLAQEPSVLNMLENAGVVPVLVHHLLPPSSEVVTEAEEALTEDDACSQCLLALSNLCKLSRPRREQAALAGVIPKLQLLIEQRHSLTEHAFVMLCDMTCASLATRRLLWSYGGAMFLVKSLAVPELQAPSLEALVGWFGVREHRADWCERLENVLLDGPGFLEQLLALFRSQEGTVFLKLLDPLLRLTRVSQKTNAKLAVSHEFLEELLHRLKGGDVSGPGHDQPRINLVTARPSKSEDCMSEAEFATKSTWAGTPQNGVRRLVSAQPLLVADDSVR